MPVAIETVKSATMWVRIRKKGLGPLLGTRMLPHVGRQTFDND